MGFTREVTWTGPTTITVREFIAIAEELKSIESDAKVHISLFVGDQREPGQVTIKVNLR